MTSDGLRIAMLSVHSSPLGKLGEKDTGGMSVYIRELARGLGDRGCLVDVYTRAHESNDGEIVDLGRNARLIHLKAGEQQGMDKLMLYPHLSEFACNLENFRARAGVEYDLVHSHYWLSGWVGMRLRQWWNVSHVMMFHTLGVVKNAVGIGEEETELRIETEGYLARGCDRIIAATEKEKRDLECLCGANGRAIGVVPCGVNLDMFRIAGQSHVREQLCLDGHDVLLYVGRIDPLKGIENLLIATSLVSRKRRIKLIIVGGGDQSQSGVRRLAELAGELGIGDAVIFMGSVGQEDLSPLYNAADVCVVPSLYESFGLVALESLACGTPVVARNVGGIMDMIEPGRTGDIVFEDDPEDMARIIERQLAKPKSDVWSPIAIRRSVERFGWPNIVSKMAEEYGLALRTPDLSLRDQRNEPSAVL